jgi:hypothetical protein
MGNECSVCSCNDQKELDDATALHFEKKDKIKRNNFNEKE